MSRADLIRIKQNLKKDGRLLLDEISKKEPLFVDSKTAVSRLSVCLGCKYLSKLKFCKASSGCYCWMPAKVMFKVFDCPLGFWKKKNDVTKKCSTSVSG